MRLSRVLIAGAAVAAAGIATSAFTASNSLEDNTIAGYDAAQVAGVIVSNIKYVQAADAAKLAKVEFTADKSTIGSDATLTLYKVTAAVGDDESLTAPSVCAPTGAAAPFVIVCTLQTPIDLEAFDKVGLTVVSQ
jgi:hypothetical protein